MKTIYFGGRDIPIKGNVLTPFIYKKEFGDSLGGAVLALGDMNVDKRTFDEVSVIQMIWALEKSTGEKIKPFEKWLEDLEYINLGEVLEEVSKEATNAVFHTSERKPKAE